MSSTRASSICSLLNVGEGQESYCPSPIILTTMKANLSYIAAIAMLLSGSPLWADDSVKENATSGIEHEDNEHDPISGIVIRRLDYTYDANGNRNSQTYFMRVIPVVDPPLAPHANGTPEETGNLEEGGGE